MATSMSMSTNLSPPYAHYQWPPEQEEALRRARRLEWASIGALSASIVAVAVVMGASQTMKAMWVEDTVSLIPSVAFLVGVHFRHKPPDDRFPYGYHRAMLIAYLAGSVALFGFGVYILGDSVAKLVMAEHPTIQSVWLFGHRVWLG
jgi:divalent metal cation (Fe/Co/Zn/Cd) transporter